MTNAARDLTKMLLDHYALVREVGRGGMAVVYLAEDRKHGRQVAIKMLSPELSTAMGSERFQREIRLLARLQHPHILPLYDSGEADGMLFFVMPFVEGDSLRERLRRTGAFTCADAARLLRQIADALDYAHARNVIHRDLKPENILLSGEQALLADFGIARSADAPTDQALTGVGVSIGTPAYMSPEQAGAVASLDARSDVYSLGCMLFEMLAGSPPFEGANAMAVICQHITDPPRPLVGAREAVPPDVAHAVERALAKEPALRFASTGEFAAAVETAVAAARAPSPTDERLLQRQHAADARRTVLVLDFTNISGTADIDWLSTGIAETLSVDLNKVGAINVIGTDGATRRKLAERRHGPPDADRVLQLGRALGASWVVWGGFQAMGARIRLTPRFTDIETGALISADKIDGAIDDIFALQDRIVTGLTELLRIRLTTQEIALIEQPQTSNLSAYELYAKGQQAFQLFGKESAKQAAEYFRRAIEMDPDYALAYVGLGSLLVPRYVASGRQEEIDEGVAALRRALELDPSLSEPWVFLSYMFSWQGKRQEALDAARQAIDREPGHHFGWYTLGVALVLRADRESSPQDLSRAIQPLLRSRALSPTHHPAQMLLGALYTMRGQYGHAITVLEEAVAVESSGTGLLLPGSYVQRAMLHLNLGELDAARDLIALALERYTATDHVYAETMTAFALFAQGLLAERERDYMKAAGAFTASGELAERFPRRSGMGPHWTKSRCALARTYAALGRTEDAQRILEEGADLDASRERYDWSWFIGASQADAMYELAASQATLGHWNKALTNLTAAVERGWADLPRLQSDVVFESWRDRPELSRLMASAASALTLPPPVGNGGMPEA